MPWLVGSWSTLPKNIIDVRSSCELKRNHTSSLKIKLLKATNNKETTVVSGEHCTWDLYSTTNICLSHYFPKCLPLSETECNTRSDLTQALVLLNSDWQSNYDILRLGLLCPNPRLQASFPTSAVNVLTTRILTILGQVSLSPLS